MARQRFDLIVFDWDGTLMDSTPTIANCINLARRDLGLPVPDDSAASPVTGPARKAVPPYVVSPLYPATYILLP